MMDIEGIPPPPPEEFEGSFHDVPLPPVDSVSWSQGPSGQPSYGNSYNSTGSSNYGDSGMAWQKAMDALNQSVAAKPPAYGSYPSAYPPPMPPPGWPPSSYAYPSSYPNSYQQQQNSQPMNVSHQYGQGYQHPAAQYGQAASQPSPYRQPPPQQQPSYGAPRAPAPQNPYRSRPPRPSMSRYTYHPYPTVNATSTVPSTGTPVQQLQKLDTRTMPPPTVQAAPSSFYSGYATAPSTSTGSGVGHHSVDMDIDEVTTTTPSSYRFPQKQAPGAGGIRFQLSKKPLSETKLSNPLLQKRFANAPPNYLPSSSTTSSHLPSSSQANTPKESPTGPSSSSGPSSPSKSQTAGLNIRSDDWPASLQNYAKAIAVTPPEKTSHVMQTITQMITNAYKTNTLHTCKWEKAPMPYADEASNELFGLSPKRENSPPTFRSSSGRGRGGRPALRRGRVNRRSDSDESDDEKSSQFSNSSRARNGNDRSQKSSSPRGGEFSGEDYLSLRKNGSSSTKKGKKGAQTGPRGKLLGFGAEAPMTEEDQAKLRKRQERFGDLSKTSSDSHLALATSAVRSNSKLRKTKSPVASSAGNPFRDRGALAQRGKSGQRAVVGTCQTVEKEYFRLTEEAEPSLIRPLSILEQALDLVRDKWKKEHNYRYAESQLKSIRQDLRVQHIFSPFTVKVYEMHARIALEVGDQAEFTQCLAQLEWLYDTLSAVQRKTGSLAVGELVPGCENRREFLSYRILYVMRQNRTTDMTRVRSQLSDEDKKDSCIAFAFSVLSAYFAGDYQQYFSLYKNAPMMAGYVMDVSTSIFRQKMLIKICTAYRPNLPVMALKEILCFSSEIELREFLKAYRLTYTWMNGAEEIDCKASLAVAKAGPEVLQPGEAQAQPQAPPPPKPKLVTFTPLRTSSKTRRRIAVTTA